MPTDYLHQTLQEELWLNFPRTDMNIINKEEMTIYAQSYWVTLSSHLANRSQISHLTWINTIGWLLSILLQPPFALALPLITIIRYHIQLIITLPWWQKPNYFMYFNYGTGRASLTLKSTKDQSFFEIWKSSMRFSVPGNSKSLCLGRFPQQIKY